MSVFILDSNMVSFYLRQNPKVIQKVHASILANDEVLISPIAYYEVKRGLLAINAEKRLNEFSVLCDTLGVGQLDNSILDLCSLIYCETRAKKWNLDDADILTAAYCKINNYTLVSNNIKHFEIISGLHYCDWSE